MKDNDWTENFFTGKATVWTVLYLTVEIVSVRLLRYSSFKVIKIMIGQTEKSVKPILIAERQGSGWKLKIRN